MRSEIEPSTREARRASRRRAILAAAEAEFAKHGFAAASMSNIAEVLGGSKSTLWTYFPSKEALFVAVIEAKVGGFEIVLNEALNCCGDMVLALPRFGRAYLSVFAPPSFRALVRLVIAEAERLPQIGEAFATRGPERILAHLCRYLQQEMEEGRLRQGDPLLASRQLIGLLRAGCYMDRPWAPSQAIDIGRDVSQAVDTFLRAWKPNRDAGGSTYDLASSPPVNQASNGQ